MTKIRALIVDDEAPARKRIRELLVPKADIEIAGESATGAEAIELIHKTTPDLLFLDIQMPGLNGFDVVSAVAPESLPVTIFITAYDSYALQAFEVNALDYLLKPFSDERFESALEKARQAIRSRQAGEFNRRLLSFLEDYRRPAPQSARDQSEAVGQLDRLVIKTRGRVLLLKTEEIDWIEAAGVYVNLHAGTETHLYRETLGALETQLDPKRFVRIHRSTIVNLDRIRELQPRSHGEYFVLLRDGTRLKLSRSYRARLHQQLGRTF